MSHKETMNSAFWSRTIAEIIKDKKNISRYIPSADQWFELTIEFKAKYNNRKELLKKITIVNSSALICGDTHGWLDGTVQIIEAFLQNRMVDSEVSLIFLGDYTDRGPNQIQNLFLVMKTTLEYEKVVLLRGNHDFGSLNEIYGFYDEIIDNYNDFRVFNQIISVYPYFFSACIINSSVLCVHAGIPIDAVQKFLSLEDMFSQFKLENIEDFMIEINETQATNKEENITAYDSINASHFQIYWNDPLSKEFDFGEPLYDDLGNRLSIRGVGSFRFSERTLDSFFKVFGLKLLIRSHEAFPSGAECLYHGKIWSIFSILEYGKPIKAKYLKIEFDERQEIKKIIPIAITPLK